MIQCQLSYSYINKKFREYKTKPRLSSGKAYPLAALSWTEQPTDVQRVADLWTPPRTPSSRLRGHRDPEIGGCKPGLTAASTADQRYIWTESPAAGWFPLWPGELWGQFGPDPPENCQLNVKKLPKTWHFSKKNCQKLSFFSTKLP